MKTAAYTICKNECKYVEKWLYYSKDFSYRVLLDTGSTDGTWELLQEAAKTDPNLIIEQKIFTPWHFSQARNYNLNMIPKEVDWCLSPDMDEYFSINVLDEIQKTITENPKVTNIACDRLDLYTKNVRVGPPNAIPTNKIHLRHDYHWVQPIYEHLWFSFHGQRPEVEIYNKDIYLIHDQDFKKQSRPELYIKMLKEEFEVNPTNCWTLWYLLSHYFKTVDLENYVKCGIVFINHSHRDERYYQIRGTLDLLYNTEPIETSLKAKLLEALGKNPPITLNTK
jgi:glycosyltransferase involved in cell wall biosynthesis